jgi:PST family polysaccharide transporter
LLLGFLHGNTAVGIYTPAQRVVSVVSRLVGPLNASLFPFVSRVGAASRIAGGRLVAAVALSGTIALSLLCGAMCWFSSEIVGLLAGSQYPGAVAVFQVLIWLPVFGYVRRVVTVLGMVNHSQEHLVFLLSNVGLFGGAVLILPLSFFYMEIGTAIGLVITEAVIAALSVYLFFCLRAPRFEPHIVEVKVH